MLMRLWLLGVVFSGYGVFVQSAIAGLQGLKAKTVPVANLDVNCGYENYLLIMVDTSLLTRGM